MSRIRIELPSSFTYTTTIPVRITDVNYGGHVGNDTILGIIHEARMQFLQAKGYTETRFAGTGLIMADAGIEFKSELFYGDHVTVELAVTNPARVSFDIFYRLSKTSAAGTQLLVAKAKTGMVCYDYSLKKITEIPAEALAAICG